MADDLQLNVALLRRRVPNLTVAARSVGLRPATVSDLCTGKIPLGRAEVRTLAALASLAGCSLDELVLRGGGAEMVETGIKVLDLLSPLVRGGTVGLVARRRLGQMVLLAELIHRLRQREFAAVVWAPVESHPDLQSVLAGGDAAAATGDDVYGHVAALRGARDVLVVADRSTVLSGDMAVVQERLQGSAGRPVTFALVDALGESPDEDLPFGPLETLWQFDVDLAARGLYPPVDPVLSTSTLLEGAHLDTAHLTLQQRARKLLRRYRELRAVVAARGLDHLPQAEAATYRQGERLEAFLSQPFFVAEPYAKVPGEWVGLSDTLDGVRRIVDGAADALTVGDLTMIGRFPTEKA